MLFSRDKLAVTMPEELVESSAKHATPAHLLPYLFQKGHAPLPGGGRPKGTKNATTILLKAAPKLAKSYIQRAPKSDAICLDARKWIMPVDEDASGIRITQQILSLDGATKEQLLERLASRLRNRSLEPAQHA